MYLTKEGGVKGIIPPEKPSTTFLETESLDSKSPHLKPLKGLSIIYTLFKDKALNAKREHI